MDLDWLLVFPVRVVRMLEVPKGTPGNDFLDWIGGYYETGFSTNPHWTARIESLPEHQITRGVKPFAVRDE